MKAAIKAAIIAELENADGIGLYAVRDFDDRFTVDGQLDADALATSIAAALSASQVTANLSERERFAAWFAALQMEDCTSDPRLDAWLARAALDVAAPALPYPQQAEQLVADMARAGLVLTVEQRPLQPLAMGHYETVISVRPARGTA